MGMDREGGWRGEAFSIDQRDSRFGCSVFHFMLPRSWLGGGTAKKLAGLSCIRRPYEGGEMENTLANSV